MRARFGQGPSFGLVSRRDRSDADQFFDDLVGRRPRAPMREAEAEWIPPEAEWSPPAPEVDEQWAEDDPPLAVITTGNPDEIIVTRADGTRYHVRRRVRAQVVLDPGRVRTALCWTDERVFGRATWCQGTQGTIDAGANLPAAAKKLVDTLVGQFTRGVGPDEIARTLENAPVQAFVELSIAKDKQWSFTGDFTLELSPSGVLSKSGQATFDKGWFKVGVEYQDDGTGKRVVAKLEIPLGKRTVRGKKCEEKQLAIWWEAECLKEVPTTYTIPPPPGFRYNQAQLYLYFEHATDLLRREPKAKSESTSVISEILASDPKRGTALLNKRMLERLEYLVGQGYFVTSIDGYTSPEGRSGPPPRRSTSKWEGNKLLAEARAKKVRDLIDSRYVPGPMRMPRRTMRFPPGRSMPSGVGHSELPELVTSKGKEPEGAQLDRIMMHGDKKATDPRPFLAQYPEELLRMTEEDRQLVGDTRLSDRKRAERLFENLRRVDINLLQPEKLEGGEVPGIGLEREGECPPDVIEAAERHWGSRIPFTKPDPPVCG